MEGEFYGTDSSAPKRDTKEDYRLQEASGTVCWRILFAIGTLILATLIVSVIWAVK